MRATRSPLARPACCSHDVTSPARATRSRYVSATPKDRNASRSGNARAALRIRSATVRIGKVASRSLAADIRAFRRGVTARKPAPDSRVASMRGHPGYRGATGCGFAPRLRGPYSVAFTSANASIAPILASAPLSKPHSPMNFGGLRNVPKSMSHGGKSA
jgi:hypothetical protein